MNPYDQMWERHIIQIPSGAAFRVVVLRDDYQRELMNKARSQAGTIIGAISRVYPDFHSKLPPKTRDELFSKIVDALIEFRTKEEI